MKKRYLAKDSGRTTTVEAATTSTTTTTTTSIEGHQEEDITASNRDIYSRLLENSFIESAAAVVAKFKLQFRWKSREEMGKTDDYSTIVI